MMDGLFYDVFLCLFFFKGNLNQPAGYSVPMVTQAPPIQPLPVRPGVIAQVRHRPKHGFSIGV